MRVETRSTQPETNHLLSQCTKVRDASIYGCITSGYTSHCGTRRRSSFHATFTLASLHQGRGYSVPLSYQFPSFFLFLFHCHSFFPSSLPSPHLPLLSSLTPSSSPLFQPSSPHSLPLLLLPGEATASKRPRRAQG